VTDAPTPVSLTTKPTDELLDVVGIGSPLVDVIARADDELLERLGLVKGSMTLIDLDQAEAIYASMPAKFPYQNHAVAFCFPSSNVDLPCPRSAGDRQWWVVFRSTEFVGPAGLVDAKS